jgi:hypothetical protein
MDVDLVLLFRMSRQTDLVRQAWKVVGADQVDFPITQLEVKTRSWAQRPMAVAGSHAFSGVFGCHTPPEMRLY